jgi:hypothetical protein
MQFKATAIRLLVVLLATWSSASIFAAETRTAIDTTKPGDAMDGLRFGSRPSRWLIQCEISGTAQWAGVTGPEHSRSFQLSSTCIREDDRFDVQTARYESGKPVHAWRSIIDGFYICYEVPPPGKNAPGGMCAAEGRHFIGAVFPSGWGGLEGYVAGDYLTFGDILQKARQVEIGQETIDGCECARLKAEVPGYGRYQAWLDSAMDYLPRKVTVEKSGGDLLASLPLSQWTHLAPPGSRGTVALTAVSYMMDQTRFERVGDRWFPLSCRVTRVQNFADGNAETTVMQSRRTRLELNPDYAALRAFQPELRQGAHLSNLVDPQLAYQWKDGQSVPLVNASSISEMNRTADALSRELHHVGAGEKR